MTAAKHTSSRDPSFRRSLLRTAGGAVGLIVGVAAVFGVLGMIGRADPDLSLDIADGTEQPADGETAPSEETAGEAAPSADEEAPAEGPDDAPEEGPSEEVDDEPPGDANGEAGETAPAEEDPVEEPAEEPAPSEPTIDPATISVQVLDGFRQDGGAAAGEVYGQLDAAGYNIIARNPAIAYDVTTVLWTAGHEAEGRQVAQEIGATEVREQPGNLSTAVNVHVVVGADRG